jgi:hypothetical protein
MLNCLKSIAVCEVVAGDDLQHLHCATRKVRQPHVNDSKPLLESNFIEKERLGIALAQGFAHLSGDLAERCVGEALVSLGQPPQAARLGYRYNRVRHPLGPQVIGSPWRETVGRNHYRKARAHVLDQGNGLPREPNIYLPRVSLRFHHEKRSRFIPMEDGDVDLPRDLRMSTWQL